jgi:S1-C subfamily serine protease
MEGTKCRSARDDPVGNSKMTRHLGVILAFVAGPAFGATPDQIIASNTRAVVFLQLEDKAGTALKSGIGFIVSQSGYILTTADLKPDPNEPDQKLMAVIGAREGIRYRLDRQDVDEIADVALWKLPQSPDCRYTVTLSRQAPKVLDRVLVLGFPKSDGLTPSSININNVEAQGGYYKTDGYLPSGNGGAPAFDEAGRVVALVHKGVQPGAELGIETNELTRIAPGINLINKWGVQAGIDSAAPTDNSCKLVISAYQPEIAISRIRFDASADPHVNGRWPMLWAGKADGANLVASPGSFSVPLRNHCCPVQRW